ncbi:MAG: hypothetical protein H7175_21535, partial [Burkholderiales bacterium]|nr:hypothetical protein [Anaerolineae bacterium]
VTRLQSLLAERHDLNQFATMSANDPANMLPFLPVVAAGQPIRARVQYVSTANLNGITYLTAFQQAAEPLTQRDFLYTFQGLSADGATYVSAVFRVSPQSIPVEVPADFNYEEFLAELPAYVDQTTTQLGSDAPEAFTPSLDTLDTLFNSFATR